MTTSRIVKVVIALSAVTLIAAASPTALAPGDGQPTGAGTVLEGPDASGPGTYIVRLDSDPLASYRGGVDDIPATNPRVRGEVKLDPDSPASRAYLDLLASEHAAFLRAAEVALVRPLEVEFSYRYAFNGLALELTPDEARTIAALPGVRQVQRSFARELHSDNGPEWIGAPALWSGEGTSDGVGTRGEGVVAGIIDTGINPGHPSFADVGGDGHDHDNPHGTFHGLCDPLTGAPFCNDKLIGVWDFTGTTPLDDHGHGSHTASTVAGNVIDPAAIEAPTITIERGLSGVAPHANLITYKACSTAACLLDSLLAAIDQAVADGVDVINYSIGGGSSDPWSDSDALAFLGARDAGVFVATSAGNSGPKSETIGSPADAPWVLTVGASTHDRAFVNAVADMSGGATTPPADIIGKSFTGGHGPAPIVHAKDHGDDGQCLNPFPPGTWDGEIVICDRGTIARVDKGTNVATGGAGGLVLANTAADGDSTVADPHVIPAVHIGYDDAQVLEAWVRDGGDGHTATIPGTAADVDDANGDVMASFSSRGPNPAVGAVVKPDVTAPGVDVLAALGVLDGQEAFGLMSGTSMSSPHAAGAAVLLRALHPDWTPAEIQSALTATGSDEGVRDSDGETPADVFDIGGGRVDLTRAGLAGFVLDESTAAYEAADPAEGGDPTTLNLATLGYTECEGTCSWTRTLRSTADEPVTWRVRTDAPRHVKIRVEPGRFTLDPGEEITLTVTAELDRTPVRKWLLGEVSFTTKAEGVPDAHLPVAILPGREEQLDLTTDATTGAHTHTYTAPIDVQRLSTSISGMAEGVVDEFLLEQDPNPFDPYEPLGVGTRWVLLDVPEGSRVISAVLGETTSMDLDLFIGRDDDGDGEPSAAEELCASTSPTAAESCSLVDPEAGTYWVMVQNWLTGRVVDDVELIATVIPGSDAGNLTVTPSARKVAEGEEVDLTFAWDEPDLDPGEAWFGLVELGSSPSVSNDVGAIVVRLTRTE